VDYQSQPGIDRDDLSRYELTGKVYKREIIIRRRRRRSFAEYQTARDI